MAVPKIGIDKNGYFLFSKNKIRFPGYIFGVLGKVDFIFLQFSGKNTLGQCTRRSDSLHIPLPLFTREIVHYYEKLMVNLRFNTSQK